MTVKARPVAEEYRAAARVMLAHAEQARALPEGAATVHAWANVQHAEGGAFVSVDLWVDDDRIPRPAP